MEKVLRRSILNRNQLVSRKRREGAKELRKSWREYGALKNKQNSELNRMVKHERTARREDWIMGPLAPRRDVSLNRETFGAIDNVLAQTPKLPRRERVGPKGKGYDAVGSEDKRQPGFEDGEWRGEGLRGNLCIDDRVVVIRGRPGVKGRIGAIQRIEKDTEMVFIKGVNKVDLRVPPQALPSAQGQKIFDQELPVHIDDIRLVIKELDTATGTHKDVIVRHVYGGWPWIQRNDGSNHPRHTRYYRLESSDGHSDREIPWPREDPEYSHTQTVDTTRKHVQEETYQYSIEERPLMPGVIGELKEKHARTRRDWDSVPYMHVKMLQDARFDWLQERNKILSQPFWTKQYLLRQKREAEQKRLANKEKAVAMEAQ